MTTETDRLNISTRYEEHNDCPTLFFCGDFVLNERWSTEPISAKIQSEIQQSNLACVNLEAPLKSGEPIDKSGPVLSTLDTTSEVLSRAGFDLACLANNHMMDYGYDGLTKTKKSCLAAGLDTVGSGENRNQALEPYIQTIQNTEIAIFNICQHEFGIASSTTPGTAWINSPGLIQNIIETAAKVDIIFAVVHGGYENIPIPSIRWQEKLREIAAAGADAVIGHHPHVPQGWEIYNDSPIFYSLGNFVFDQSSYDGNRWGITVSFTLSDCKIDSTKIILVEHHKNSVQLLDEIRKKHKHIEYLDNSSKVIQKSPQKPKYWQEVACRLYEKYERFFRRFGGGDPVSIYKSPIREIGRITHLILNREETELTNQEYMRLLNTVRCEAHQDVLISGIEIRANNKQDYRDEKSKNEIDEMMEFLS